MKILTLVWSISIGGTERAAVNYAIGYKKFGIDSRVLVLGDGFERYPDLQSAGVATTLVFRDKRNSDEIYREFKNWQPDIIHVHNFHDGILPYISLVKSGQTKVVETNVFSRPNLSDGYQIVNLSMQLSAWGYWKYNRWMKGAGYRPEIAVVPYIVDNSKFVTPAENEIAAFLKLHHIPAGAYVIGRIGQAFPSKWDMRLLEVIKKTIDSANNIYYLLVGLPPNMMSAFNEQDDFFKSRVMQIDRIEGDQNLSLYYHSLDCFAHISKIGESFGYVLGEAMTCKVPVVTMLTPLKDNAQFEVVGNGQGGFCATNTGEFIGKTLQLYQDKRLREQIKLNLNGWVEGRFSFDVVIPFQLSLYRRLLANEVIPAIKVDRIINDNFNLYGYKKFFYLTSSKFVNHYFLPKLIMCFKKIMRRD